MPRPVRGYRTADGSRVPGVTTVVKVLQESGGLIFWAWSLGVEGKDYREARDTAASAGTLAHAKIEAAIRGTEIPTDPNPEIDRKAANALERFLHWREMTRAEIRVHEEPLVSEQHGYGGTPDALATINGRACLFDWKAANGVYCLTPGHRVLTDRLEWRPVESLAVGDGLLAFSEDRVKRPGRGLGGREWQRGYVTFAEPGVAEVVRINLASGRSLTCTLEHRWLTVRTSGGRKMKEGGTLWVAASDLQVGNRLVRYLEPWESLRSWEAGWLAGIFDGEGFLTKGKNPTSYRLGVCQKEGKVAEQIRASLAGFGFQFTERTSTSGVVNFFLLGGLPEIVRLLGSLRPLRLMAKLQLPGTLQAPRAWRDPIVGLELLGKQVIVKLSTSTGTYFAEGYGAHNCEYLAQLGGYAILLEEHGSPRIEEAHLLRFDKECESWTHHQWGATALEQGRQAFLAALGAYEWIAPLKRAVA
jgi:hypothetical protein